MAIKISDLKDRLPSYTFQNHKNDIGKITDCTEPQLNQIRVFFNSIKGRTINDIAIFNNRLTSNEEEIVRCKIKGVSPYNFSLINQSTNTLFSKVTDFNINKKDRLITFLETINEKTLSFRRRNTHRSHFNEYRQNGLPTLNTRHNCIIFSSRAIISKLTDTLHKYKKLYAPNDNLVYGNYIETVKARGFINNWVGIIIIILGTAFIIFKLLEYFK